MKESVKMTTGQMRGGAQQNVFIIAGDVVASQRGRVYHVRVVFDKVLRTLATASSNTNTSTNTNANTAADNNSNNNDNDNASRMADQLTTSKGNTPRREISPSKGEDVQAQFFKGAPITISLNINQLGADPWLLLIVAAARALNARVVALPAAT